MDRLKKVLSRLNLYLISVLQVGNISSVKIRKGLSRFLEFYNTKSN